MSRVCGKLEWKIEERQRNFENVICGGYNPGRKADMIEKPVIFLNDIYSIRGQRTEGDKADRNKNSCRSERTKDGKI